MQTLKIVRRTTTNRAAAPVAQPKAPVVQLHEDDEVMVIVPKDFILTDDEHAPHKYKAGTYYMDREHANHWWARAHGVTVVPVRHSAA